MSPRFGFVGQKPSVCGSHRQPGMVNLKDRRCEMEPCTIQPTFAFPGDKPRYCSKHKCEGMVNVRHKLCQHPTCSLVPTYGREGTRIPVFCRAHRMTNMVDLKRAREAASRPQKVRIYNKRRAGEGGGEGRGDEGAGKMRPRPQRLDRAVGRRRNIIDSIFASSEGLGQAVADRVAGELEGGSDESEWEEGSGAEAEEDLAPSNVHVLPVGFPPPQFPFPPPMPDTIDTIAPQRLPFHQSPLALLPGAVPRGEAAHAIELQVMAAVAAAASTAQDVNASGAAADDSRHTEGQPSVRDRRMMPGFSDIQSEGGDGRGSNGKSAADDAHSGRSSLSSACSSAGNGVAEGREGSTEALEEASEGTDSPGRRAGAWTTLTWNCVGCGKAVPADDRHVLVCCGYGVLHKACTALFTLPLTAAGAWPCPKCRKHVYSSLQIFM